jgi:hypothetical protein
MANQVSVCGPNESVSIECLMPGELFRYKIEPNSELIKLPKGTKITLVTGD